jgi:hypothetical protein
MAGMPHTPLAPSLWRLDYPTRPDASAAPLAEVILLRAKTARQMYGVRLFQVGDANLPLPFLRRYGSVMRQPEWDLRLILPVGACICGTLAAELPVGSTQVRLLGDGGWAKLPPPTLPPQITFMSGDRETLPYRAASVVYDSQGSTLYFERPTTRSHPAGTVVCCWANLVRQLDAIKAAGYLDRVGALYAMHDPKTARNADGAFIQMNLAPVQAELRQIVQRMGVQVPIIWGLADPAAFSSFDYEHDYVLSYTHPVRTWGFAEAPLRQRTSYLAQQNAKAVCCVQTGDLGLPKTYGACDAHDIYNQLTLGAAPVRQDDGRTWRPVTVAWFTAESLLEGPQDANSASAAVEAMKPRSGPPPAAPPVHTPVARR